MEDRVRLTLLLTMGLGVKVLKSAPFFSIQAVMREMSLGEWELLLKPCQGKGSIMELMAWLGWIMRREAEMLSPPVEFLFFFLLIIMNIIVWNCKGALKPNFQSHVKDLAKIHNPSILVVMETRVGGDRASSPF